MKEIIKAINKRHEKYFGTSFHVSRLKKLSNDDLNILHELILEAAEIQNIIEMSEVVSKNDAELEDKLINEISDIVFNN